MGPAALPFVLARLPPEDEAGCAQPYSPAAAVIVAAAPVNPRKLRRLMLFSLLVMSQPSFRSTAADLLSSRDRLMRPRTSQAP